jgi:2-phosphosulfolactate phosphatase
LAGGIAVVIDVLRATTVMVHALAAGCEAVIPCAEIDEAREIAATRPPGSSILAGERHGLPIPGFDLGNSPSAFTPDVCRGKTLIITTTNGTRAILASLEAEQILLGALVNRLATSERLVVNLLKRNGRPVHLVCAGTDGHISFEDSLLAGALAAKLWSMRAPLGNDEALIAASTWNETQHDLERFAHRPAGGPAPAAVLRDDLLSGLSQILARGRGGRRVTEIGLEEDIIDAANLDRFNLIAELERDPIRIVRAT